MMITSLIKDEDDDDECNDMIIKRSVSWTRRKDRWACPLSPSPLLCWLHSCCLHGNDHDDHEDVDDSGDYDKEICVENYFDIFLVFSTIIGSSPWRARFCDESIILRRQIPISEIPRVDALGTRLSLSIHLNRHLIVKRILEHT